MVSKLSPSVTSLKEFQLVTLGLKLAGKELRGDIAKATRETLNPEWRKALAERADTHMEQTALVKGARVAAGNPAVLIAASSRRPLRKGAGGFIPDRDGGAIEFGPHDPGKKIPYSRRGKSGRQHTVTRATRAGLPAWRSSGRVVYPAFAELAPRMTSLWVQIVMKKVSDVFDGK